MSETEILYFGCIREAGHYLVCKSNPRIRYHETPWGNHLDGGILERAKNLSCTPGVCVTERKDGWTAVDFWDYSVDSRPGSHSCFLAAANLSASEVLELARVQWPEVFSRPKFPKLSHHL